MKAVLLVVSAMVLAGASPVAAAGPFYANPVWSPDGKRIAFTDGGQAGGDLYVMNANGSNIRALFRSSLTPGGARSPSWSPDGHKVTFTYRDQGIYVINSNGSSLKHISATGDMPAWSPGGTRIAFSEYPTETSGSVIYVVRPDGRGEQVVAAPKNDYDSYLAPEWSSDGQRPAFAVENAPDAGDLPGRVGVVSQYNGRVSLFLRGKNARPYSWHGAKIAVDYDPITSDGIVPHRLGILDTRTTKLTYLRDGHHPSWSPDGRHLTFSYRGNVWVIDANGARARQLTHS
jgi:Tol biopolymer transport system component